jgi:hypothetical protein
LRQFYRFVCSGTAIEPCCQLPKNNWKQHQHRPKQLHF